MDIQLLVIFITLNILNVVIQTVKNLVTIKCGKGIAAIVNAIAFGLYTVVTVYMMCNLPLAWKAIIVALCNLVGVYVVKWFEEKARKDKLWKIEATIASGGPLKDAKLLILKNDMGEASIPFNYIDLEKFIIINCYCSTQEQSRKAKQILDQYNAKYFVSESKNL